MLVKPDDSGLPFNGRNNGGLWLLTKGRIVAKGLFQHASREQRRTYVQERYFEPARAVWESLTGPQKHEWSILAETCPQWTKGLAVAFTSGKELFLQYNTNGLFFGTIDDWQVEPPEAPTWGERPEFAPFASISGGDSWELTVTVALEAGTKLALYGMSPFKGETALRRNELRFCGLASFPEGLSVGDIDSSLGALYIERFGLRVTDPSHYQWAQLYQVERGWMRILRDPCKPPKPPVPPGYVRVHLINGTPTLTVTSANGAQLELVGFFSEQSIVVEFPDIVPGGEAIFDVANPYGIDDFHTFFVRAAFVGGTICDSSPVTPAWEIITTVPIP